MKNIKQNILILIISLISTLQAHASVVEFSTDFTSMSVGDTLEVSIFAKDFEELAGGVINFSISSPSSISIDDVVIHSYWDFIPEKGDLKGRNWEGIGFDAFMNEPLNGDSLIATLSITGLNTGITTLSLLDSSMFFDKTVQLNTSEIINTAGVEITVTSVSQVPIPAAFWFMGSALIGLAGLKRKAL